MMISELTLKSSAEIDEPVRRFGTSRAWGAASCHSAVARLGFRIEMENRISLAVGAGDAATSNFSGTCPTPIIVMITSWSGMSNSAQSARSWSLSADQLSMQVPKPAA